MVAVLLFSCEKNVGKIKKAEILSLPSITAKNDTTIYTDSGRIQLILFFPLMETYNNAEEPYSEFRYGINVVFYDGHPDPVGRVTAKYARYIDKKETLGT